MQETILKNGRQYRSHPVYRLNQRAGLIKKNEEKFLLNGELLQVCNFLVIYVEDFLVYDFVAYLI
jgi:hypothetical protein